MSTSLLFALGIAACADAVVAPEISSVNLSVAPVSNGLTVTPSTPALQVDGTVQLEAYDDSGNKIKPNNWTSDNSNVATVSSSGVVTARANGVATITARANRGRWGTSVVSIGTPFATVASVEVTPAQTSVEVGATTQLTAVVKDLSGNTLSGATVTWSSSSTSIATVNSNGVVSGVAAGSATITAISGGKSGTAAVTVTAAVGEPSGPSTSILPGEDIQAKVNAHPAGTSFLLKAGVHRMQQVYAKDGNSFIGEPGAVISGARLLTAFTREGGYWVASGVNHSGWTQGQCTSEYPRCKYSEDLFIEDVPLRHVATRAEVGPGRWFFDYPTNKVYFADDPTGKRVEISERWYAFWGSARNVTVRGLTIEKYANPAQHGAIHGDAARDWIVEANTIRLNHGVGVRFGHRFVVRNNRILRNGQLGIGGAGNDAVVEGNEVAHGNWAGFDWSWEAGGAKFVYTERLVVRNNHVHNNHGPGLWTDIDNIHTLYEGNVVEDNGWMGIFHEISYDAVIRNNTVRRNGSLFSVWLWGAGILVAGSSNVEIYGNTVEDNANGITGIQQNRGGGKYGPWKLRNLKVYENTVRMTSGRSGIAADDGDPDVGAPLSGNHFDRNTYHVDSSSSQRWHWTSSGATDWMGWRNLKQDVNGRVNP